MSMPQTKSAHVPGFLPDLPNVRKEMAQYYSSARRFDDTLGRVLDALNEVGASNNTIVNFCPTMALPCLSPKLTTTFKAITVRW